MERSLIASLAAIGVEIQRHEGDEATETHSTWHVNALDLDGSAETFNQMLRLMVGFGESENG